MCSEHIQLGVYVYIHQHILNVQKGWHKNVPVASASQKVVLWQHMYAAVGIFDDDYYKITTQSHGKEF